VSTLPGSHKSFGADESLMRKNLSDFALWLDDLASRAGLDFHLGLEPEPFGYFENTHETVRFFDRLRNERSDSAPLSRRLGINYDTCHFALQYEPAADSLNALASAGIRISKIHLSNALALDPQDESALAAIRNFDEPIYLHQVIARRHDGSIERFPDLPEFLAANKESMSEARVHFHIPLDSSPTPPLRSTRSDVLEVLNWRAKHPQMCQHYEIETYTWAVLPQPMQRPVDEQIAAEYSWVMRHAQISPNMA
ncbi:MAG: hypothetical protein ACO3RV_04910, partial [Luteolibacter sp.]